MFPDPAADEPVCHHLPGDALSHPPSFPIDALQEVNSHAMILLEEPAAAFNVHQAGLDVPPAHVCRLPPRSPGTSELRPEGGSAEFIAAEKSTSWP